MFRIFPTFSRIFFCFNEENESQIEVFSCSNDVLVLMRKVSYFIFFCDDFSIIFYGCQSAAVTGIRLQRCDNDQWRDIQMANARNILRNASLRNENVRKVDFYCQLTKVWVALPMAKEERQELFQEWRKIWWNLFICRFDWSSRGSHGRMSCDFDKPFGSSCAFGLL